MRPAAATLRRWRENPVQFAVECCKFEPDAWQRAFLSDFPSQDPRKQRIALQACTGPGKTAALAIAALNFVGCYGGEYDHPQGLCTSITGANLHQNLWPALASWQRRSEWLQKEFRWTATRFSSVQFPQTWFIEARAWARKANADEQGRTFSGLHSPFVMVILDETGDVPLPVLRSAEQIFSTRYRWAKVCQGGNPTSREGHALFHAAMHPDLWFLIRITGDPDNPKRSPRIDLENARRQIQLYGREDPWVMATILGEFPHAAINALLSSDEIQAAMERRLEPEVYSWAQKRLGVDVSRFGDDPTELFPRQGLRAFKSVTMRHKRDSTVSVNIANRILLAKQKWNWEQLSIDATGGWAAGTRDILVAGGHPVLNIQYHAPAPDPRYKNMRAFMHWNGAQWVKGGGWLPNDPELAAELAATTYSYVGGQMLMEPKDQVKAKIGRSPNKADAFYQTFATPDEPGQMEQKLREKLMPAQSHASTDFDPFREDDFHLRRPDIDWDPSQEI